MNVACNAKSVFNGVARSVLTYYVGGYYELMVEGQTETERKYYAAGSTTIAMREEGTLYWLLDRFGIRCANSLNICKANVHLGSTSITTEDDGTKYSELRYTAFGEVRFSDDTTPTDRRFTGQRIEAEIGLYYYIARWYDPYLNRWIQPDSIVPDPYNSQDWDRFNYTRNNPLRYIDPTGHSIEPPNCPNGCVIWDYSEVGGAGIGGQWLRAAISTVTELVDLVITNGTTYTNPSESTWNMAGAEERFIAGTMPPALGVVGGSLDEIARAASNLADNATRKIPYGFKTIEEFEQFSKTLSTGLTEAGYTDVQSALRGSSVTGSSFRSGLPFDVGRTSDLDLALSSPSLFSRAQDLGIPLRGGGTRTGPLLNDNLAALGLESLKNQLSVSTGRKVSFMIYNSMEAIVKRGPHYLIY